MRKLYEFSQSQAPGQDMQGSGCRRCWGEWNDHPDGMSKPNLTYQGGYRSRGQIWENIIGTWRQTGSVGDSEGIIRLFYACPEANPAAYLQVLGSLFYLSNTQPPSNVTQLATADCGAHMTFRDTAAIVESNHAGVKPFMFRNNDDVTPDANNVCERCVGVSSTPSVNHEGSGWSMPGYREGRTLAEAMGGANVYEALPGLCSRYEGGVLTSQGLYPWPMNDRIKAARRASGAPEVDVTATVESLLGKIPPECRSDTPKPPDPTPEPSPAALSCTGDLLAQGKIAMQCLPQTRKR
jgi:hypothetical protein